MAETPRSCEIGVVGLGVMGQNLALNIADHGRMVAVYNRTTEVTDGFMAANPEEAFAGTGGGLHGAATLGDFIARLERPRRIVLLVKAGSATQAVIDALTPLLDRGDCIIDAGNALWTDTSRRERALAERGLLFVGSGVSGGEEGARFGPSLMPGGAREAWELIKPIWIDIAAKVDPGTGKPLTGARPGRPVRGGVPCAAYIGADASGHYVKMVHNGIEYADMQLIGESYAFMRDVLGMEADGIGGVFAEWSAGELDSFLIEITADLLRHKDPRTGRPFVDVVLDAAGQKGTGKWTSSSALELDVPAPTIAEAVSARLISSMKEERSAAAAVLARTDAQGMLRDGADAGAWIARLGDALYCSKICAYAQGFALMASASRAHGWGLDPGTIAGVWRGGCIIRARFLQKITEACTREPALKNLMVAPYFAGALMRGQEGWRAIVARAALAGVAVPAFASALAYFDSYRSERLPANLLQAQRDYFGSHTYERIDQPRGRFFHTDWPHPDRPELEA